MSANLVVWVKYGSGRATRVEVPSGCVVDGLIKAIKLELSDELNGIGLSQIDLVEDVKEGAKVVVYASDAPVSDIVGGNSASNPILIETTGNKVISFLYRGVDY
jgi:hypothetical protein